MNEKRAAQLRREFAERVEETRRAAAVLSRPWKIACGVLTALLLVKIMRHGGKDSHSI